MWVDDPDFDIDHHVRRIALPKPGTMRQLLDLATLIAADPFDRTRPLWQFVVVDGLRGGKAALIQKMHHTITDGEGGVQTVAAVPRLRARRARAAAARPDEPTEPTAAPPPPSTADDAARPASPAAFRLPLGIARQVQRAARRPGRDPDARAPRPPTRSAGVVSQLVRHRAGAARRCGRERSLRRRLEVVRAPVRTTKDAAKRLGGTLNTAFLTAAAEAAARYHVELGRTGRARCGRRWRSAPAPTTPGPTPSRSPGCSCRPARCRSPSASRRIHEADRRGRGPVGERQRSTTLAAVAAALPTSLVTRLARQQAQTVDFATSNVRGSPVPVYIAGAQLLAELPVGPLGGVAFNLTLLSYLGSLDMGLNIDAAAVDRAGRLRSSLERAFADLAATPDGATSRPARPARRLDRARPARR